MLKVECYFEMDDTTDVDRIKIFALHLEGRAIQWHQSFIKSKLGGIVTWDENAMAMKGRFGSYGYDDPLADLRNLKQIGSLQHYMDSFEELYPRAGINDDQALSFFLSRLADLL